jgi:hypothetical protein
MTEICLVCQESPPASPAPARHSPEAQLMAGRWRTGESNGGQEDTSIQNRVVYFDI